MSTHPWSTARFTRDGVHLHYWKKGAGAPMLLLHGITDSGACWGRTADALAASYTVYALDQRGHGQSDAPAAGYSYDEYVLDAVALLRANELDHAIVMGHSFGGRVGMKMAASYPLFVSKLILVDPPLFEVDVTTPREALDQLRYDWFHWLRETRRFTRDALVEGQGKKSPRWSRDECEHWADSKLQFKPRLWEQEGVQMSGDWRAALSKISCPTLLVYGDPAQGGLIDDARAAEVVDLLQHGTAVQIPDAGHSVHRDEHASFMYAIREFLHSSPP